MKRTLKNLTTEEVIEAYLYTDQGVDFYLFSEADYNKVSENDGMDWEDLGIDKLDYIDTRDFTIIKETDYLALTDEEKEENPLPDFIICNE